jgi:xanthine dehydrogenase FAD-binding subunit
MFDFEALYEARSVSHAIELLCRHPKAKIVAGGSDLLIKIREGREPGLELVSIFTLDELRGVSMREDGALCILPLTSFSHVIKSPLIQERFPVLAQALSQAGGPQIRNIATIGGNICNGVTSADSASTLLAWDAQLEITGPSGVRRLHIGNFYLGAGKVDLKPAEILTAILISRESYAGYSGRFIKYSMRRAMDIATIGCSVNVKLTEDKKTIFDARIAFGVTGPVPQRAPAAEAAARGKAVGMETVEEFAKAALEDISPRTSWRATREFRAHMAKEMAKRALIESIKLAGGELQ